GWAARRRTCRARSTSTIFSGRHCMDFSTAPPTHQPSRRRFAKPSVWWPASAASSAAKAMASQALRRSGSACNASTISPLHGKSSVSHAPRRPTCQRPAELFMGNDQERERGNSCTLLFLAWAAAPLSRSGRGWKARAGEGLGERAGGRRPELLGCSLSSIPSVAYAACDRRSQRHGKLAIRDRDGRERYPKP